MSHCSEVNTEGNSSEAANLKAGDLLEFELKGVKWRFRWCPAGSFMMGSPTSEKDRKGNETQHRVTLTRGFWMGETQVTQEQWRAVMSKKPSYFSGKNLPVEQVSWNDCQDFAQKLNASFVTAGIDSKGYHFSLPTEVQWEYACRAGSTTAYCSGDNVDSLADYAWYGKKVGHTGRTTHSVGTRKPNGWGLYDMHGNVWEWCQDLYGNYGAGASPDADRVIRGGSWFFNARVCRSAYRDHCLPKHSAYYIGLRVCLAQTRRHCRWLSFIENIALFIQSCYKKDALE